MRQGSWLRCLMALAVCCSLAACDPYAYYPARSQPVTPPPAEGQTGAAPPAAAPAPAPPPDLATQVKALEARVQQLETRLAEAEASRPAAPAASRRTSERVTKAPAGYPPPTAGGDNLYVEGYRLYQAKKYGAARDKFAKYLKAQPQGPKAPEARYYLAYSFQHEGKPKEAAVEFNKLVTQFPKSNLAPAALKQQALAYKSDNQTKLYQSTLKKLAQAYPRSPEAQEAQKLLKEGGR